MKPRDIAALRRLDCPKRVYGFICEAHPDTPWPHDSCSGPGMPCDAPGCVQDRLDAQLTRKSFRLLRGPTEQQPAASTPVRKLWRMQARRIVTAALFSHPAGNELRVYFEPEEAGDLLHSQVERLDLSVLEDKAAEMRHMLLEKGWTDVDG